MNWMLIIVAAILIINALIGWKTGFIKMIFSLCFMILAVVLTLWISPYVNNFMRGNDKIYGSVTEKVEKVLPKVSDKTDKNEQISTIEGLTLPKSIKDALIENNNTEVYKKLAVNSFQEYLSNYLTGIVINALAFVITFAIILISLWVLCFVLDLISKLPLLNQVNHLAGLLAGLVHGLVIVWIFFLVLTVFQSSELGQKAMQMIGDNEILSLIYNNNILIDFVTSATKIL